MSIRRSAVVSLFVGGLVLAALSGCSAGNPYLSDAEDAMDQSNYDRALARVDSALAQDSANVDAYKMRAQIFRSMADTTMSPDEYKDLYRRARAAEEKAIEFNPGARSDIEGQRTLAYTQQFQQGASTFQRAQRTAEPSAYGLAAARFGAAAATYPDSADATLNEAYARLNMQRTMEDGSMTNVIPVLEDYVEKTDEVEKNAYDLLSALYIQNEQYEDAISLLERAREDLGERPPYFQIGGSQGLSYTGTVNEGGESRSVEGTVPDRISLNSDGTVSGEFQKDREKGQLQVRLFYKGTSVRDTTIRGTEPVSLSTDLSDEAPLAEIEGRLLNAYNRAGRTEEAMAEYRSQIEENPENATYRYNYGSMLLNADRYDEAIEQLSKAVELEPGNARAQYNLGAAYTNKATVIQDSLQQVNDSLRSVREAAMEENRGPTDEEEELVTELDQKQKQLAQQRLQLFKQSIPPLERARQLADQGESLRESACQALVTAYVQTEQIDRAQQIEECAGMEGEIQQEGGGNQQGGGNQ